MEASRALAWWIAPEDASKYSVLLPLEAFESSERLIEELRSRTDDLQAMQQRLAQVRTADCSDAGRSKRKRRS